MQNDANEIYIRPLFWHYKGQILSGCTPKKIRLVWLTGVYFIGWPYGHLSTIPIVPISKEVTPTVCRLFGYVWMMFSIFHACMVEASPALSKRVMTSSPADSKAIPEIEAKGIPNTSHGTGICWKWVNVINVDKYVSPRQVVFGDVAQKLLIWRKETAQLSESSCTCHIRHLFGGAF